MKKFLFFLSAGLVFLFFACEDIETLRNLSDNKPESISIETNARFEVPVGGQDAVLLEKFGIEMIQDAIDENLPSDDDDEDNLTPVVYDYNPGKSDSNTLTYIIDYPVLKYNLSLKDDAGNDINFDVNQVPIGPKPIDGSPNFNEIISNKLNIPSQTLAIPELGDEVSIDKISEVYPGFNPTISATISAPDFETMSFYTGNLDITITPKDASNISDNFVLSPSITLYSGGIEISKSSDDKVVEIKKAAEPITLKLDGKTLKKDLKIVVSGSISGGKTPELNLSSQKMEYKLNEYEFSVSTSNISLKEVKGLNMKNDELGAAGKIKFDQSFALSALNKHLKSADVKDGTLQIYSELPEGWSGIQIDSANSKFVVSGGLDLDDTDFTDGEGIGSKYILNKTANLKNQIIEPGTEVSTAGSYISVSLTNATVKFEKNKETKLSINGLCTINELGNVIIAIGDLQTIKDKKDTGLNFSTILSDALDGEESDLLKNVEFTGMEAYFFVTQPTKNKNLNSLAITGTVKADYTDKNEVQKERTLVNIPSDSKEPIRIKPTILTLDSLADEKHMITEDTIFRDEGEDSLYSYKLKDEDIGGLLNDLPDNLVFDYDLAIKTDSTDGTATLTQDDIDLVQQKAQISISLAIVIPLEIILNDDYDFPSGTAHEDGWITIDDIMNLVGKTEEDKTDLLNRDSPDKFEDKTKYTDIIKSLSLIYTIDNKTDLELKLKVDDESNTGIVKDLVTEPGSHTLDFSREDIDNVMDNFFNPKFKVAIKASETNPETGKKISFKFRRDAAFSFKGIFSVATDGALELWNKND